MKNSVVLKSLIDIFFFIHVIGFVASLGSFLFGFVDIGNLEVPEYAKWIILTGNVIVYFMFLLGLFFLRRMARIFLSRNHFSESLAGYMKISGNQFVYAALISVLVWLVAEFFDFDYKSVYKLLSINPVFLMIIGLFFTIQSKTLYQAVRLKSESDLTI